MRAPWAVNSRTPPGPNSSPHVYLDHFGVSFRLPRQQVLGFLKPPALVFVDHCGRGGGRGGGHETCWPLGDPDPRPLCTNSGSLVSQLLLFHLPTDDNGDRQPELSAFSQLQPHFPHRYSDTGTHQMAPGRSVESSCAGTCCVCSLSPVLGLPPPAHASNPTTAPTFGAPHQASHAIPSWTTTVTSSLASWRLPLPPVAFPLQGSQELIMSSHCFRSGSQMVPAARAGVLLCPHSPASQPSPLPPSSASPLSSNVPTWPLWTRCSVLLTRIHHGWHRPGWLLLTLQVPLPQGFPAHPLKEAPSHGPRYFLHNMPSLPQFPCPLVYLSAVYPLNQCANPRRVRFGP